MITFLDGFTKRRRTDQSANDLNLKEPPRPANSKNRDAIEAWQKARWEWREKLGVARAKSFATSSGIVLLDEFLRDNPHELHSEPVAEGRKAHQDIHVSFSPQHTCRWSTVRERFLYLKAEILESANAFRSRAADRSRRKREHLRVTMRLATCRRRDVTVGSHFDENRIEIWKTLGLMNGDLLHHTATSAPDAAADLATLSIRPRSLRRNVRAPTSSAASKVKRASALLARSPRTSPVEPAVNLWIARHWAPVSPVAVAHLEPCRPPHPPRARS